MGAALILAVSREAVGADYEASRSPSNASIAAFLLNNGLRPGDGVALIGNGTEAYWRTWPNCVWWPKSQLVSHHVQVTPRWIFGSPNPNNNKERWHSWTNRRQSGHCRFAALHGRVSAVYCSSAVEKDRRNRRICLFLSSKSISRRLSWNR